MQKRRPLLKPSSQLTAFRAQKILQSSLTRLLLPTALVALGLLIQFIFRIELGLKYYILLYPCVFAGSLVGGLLPGIFATLIAAIGVWWFFIPESHLLNFNSGSETYSLLIFILTGVVSSLFGEKLRRAQENALFSKSQVEAVLKVKKTSEDRLRVATKAANLYSWDWDLSNSKIWRSENHDQQYGLIENSVDFQPSDFFRHIFEGDRERVSQELNEAITACSELSTEYRMIWPDQSIHWMQSIGTVYTKADGTAHRISGCSLDISDRKFAESERTRLLQNLESEKQRLYSLFKQSPVGVFIVEGADHVFTLANEPHLKLVGRDIIGKKISEVFTPKELKNFEPELDQVFKTGVIYQKDEVQMKLDENRSLYLNFSFYPFQDDQHSTKGVLGFVQDVTEQVEAKNRVQILADDLKKAVVVRDQFLSIASHELKTPLTSLKMQVQMRQRNLLKNNLSAFTPEKLVKMFDGDDRQINRLTRLIDDMLDISRMSTGKLTIHKEISDLSLLVREVSERLAEQISLAGCSLKLQTPDFCIGFWDRFRIEQVVINLLTNAIRYGAGHPIELSIEKDDKMARISVRDHGMGIAPENHKKIFQPMTMPLKFLKTLAKSNVEWGRVLLSSQFKRN